MPESFTITEAGSFTNADSIAISGQLDARTAPALNARCAVIRQDKRHLILNLADVGFIASSGIGTLLSIVETFQQDGLRVRLIAPSEAVRSVIELLNLDPFLSIDDSEATALVQLEN